MYSKKSETFFPVFNWCLTHEGCPYHLVPTPTKLSHNRGDAATFAVHDEVTKASQLHPGQLFLFKERRIAALGGIRIHDTLQSRRVLYQQSCQGNSAGRGSNHQHSTTQHKANLKPLCYGTEYPTQYCTQGLMRLVRYLTSIV